MTELERRYRRLLKAYPAGHRATYEQEMIGVLLAGSGPEQRFPALADTFDLLWAGLRTRAAGWRNAAAVAGLLGAVFLATVAIRRLLLGVHVQDPMTAYGVKGLLLLDVAARSVAWLAVVAAVLIGRRQVTLVAAAAAALVEIAATLAWPPAGTWSDNVLSGRLALVLLVAALLPAAPLRRRIRGPGAGR